jgi:hypothetical protein
VTIFLTVGGPDPDRGRQALRPLGLGGPAHLDQQQRVVLQALGDQGMHRSQPNPADLQRLEVMGFGQLIPALGGIEHAQVIQARRHVRMLGTEGLASDLERPRVERFGLLQTALGVEVLGQVVEAGRCPGRRSAWPGC